MYKLFRELKRLFFYHKGKNVSCQEENGTKLDIVRKCDGLNLYEYTTKRGFGSVVILSNRQQFLNKKFIDILQDRMQNR